MTKSEILQADLPDILFEHKNKLYGAYALRKKYPKHLALALVIVLFFVVIAVLFSIPQNKNKKDEFIADTNDFIILKTYPVLSEPEPPKEKTEMNLNKVKSLDRIQIVPDNTETDMPDQADILHALISSETIAGKELADPNLIIHSALKNDEENISAPIVPDDDFVSVQIAPSFPGGIEAWLSFLKRNLQAPGELEPDQKIEVWVQFRIDKDGNLSGFEIRKSGGNQYDKEVLRVMRKMPKWEPAKQNNQRVAVSYTQPVIFMGVEE